MGRNTPSPQKFPIYFNQGGRNQLRTVFQRLALRDNERIGENLGDKRELIPHVETRGGS